MQHLIQRLSCRSPPQGKGFYRTKEIRPILAGSDFVKKIFFKRKEAQNTQPSDLWGWVFVCLSAVRQVPEVVHRLLSARLCRAEASSAAALPQDEGETRS